MKLLWNVACAQNVLRTNDTERYRTMHIPTHTDRQKTVARPKKMMKRSALARTERSWMASTLL